MQESFVRQFQAVARMDDCLSGGLPAHHFFDGRDGIMHGEKFADVFFAE
jgi:hypothetical protein